MLAAVVLLGLWWYRPGMEDFGVAVRAARLERGWTQKDLAQRVSASQRAVSAWETGSYEPEGDLRELVVALLELQVGAIPAEQRMTSRHPGRPALSELPFERLSPDEFENFAASLLNAIYGLGSARRLGKSGHAQDGFDVIVQQSGRTIAAVQCKRVAQFGPARVNKAVLDAKTKTDMAYIFVSRIIQPAAYEEMLKHPGWELWDKNTLSHRVHDLPEPEKARIVDRYFPDLFEDFLGVPRGPWLSAEQYFSRTTLSDRYTHDWRLVGRDDLLEDLCQFAGGEKYSPRVGLIVGTGGIGKSKLLFDMSHRLNDGGHAAVRFLDRDADLGPRAFSQLPAGRLLVVLDDAHDYQAGLGALLSGIRSVNRAAVVLLATRPYGEPMIRRALRSVGLAADEVFRREVADLSVLEAEQLAREALGPRFAHFALRLAHAARDCPLLLVAGADLIKEGKLDPAHIEDDERLRLELTDMYADVIGAEAATFSEVRVEVLNAVAALQPVRAEQSVFREALSVLTGRPFDQVKQHLRALEDAGVLLQRNESYRIVPDLLGDALLVRASVGRAGGSPTGYLDRVLEACDGDALANLIINAGRIDWQERAKRRSGLLDPVWAVIGAWLREADSDMQASLLRILAHVSFFQPGPCLELTAYALDGPDGPTAPEPAPVSAPQWVRDAASEVLRGVAYDHEAFPKAVDLLWRLATDDERPTNQHPEHPMRVLAELVGIESTGPSIRQDLILAAVERWMDLPGPTACDPLDVLQPLLAAEGHDEIWDAQALVMRSYAIDPRNPAVIALRGRVLDLALDQLKSGNAQRAFAALELVGGALIGPIGVFRLKVTDEDRELWEGPFLDTLDHLQRAISDVQLAPALYVTLRYKLQWLGEHGSARLQQAVRAVLSCIPVTLDNQLARALHGGPADLPEDAPDVDDMSWRHEAVTALFQSVILLLDELSAGEAARLVEGTLAELHAVYENKNGTARPFLFDLAKSRPDIGVELTARMEESPDGPLSHEASIVLIALAQEDGPRALDPANSLLATGSLLLTRQVAVAFGTQRGRTELADGEGELLRTLVSHTDPVVHAHALAAVHNLARMHPDLAIELLTIVPPEREGFAFGEFAMAVGPAGPLEWNAVPEEYKDRYFAALARVERLDNFPTEELLVDLSHREPRRVLDLLIKRSEAFEGGGEMLRMLPLPTSPARAYRFHESPEFPSVLRELREWLAAAPVGGWRSINGPQLFTLVAGDYGPEVAQVIAEYFDQADPTRMAAVALMLRHAPNHLVWDIEFIRRCLHAAQQAGSESLSQVEGAMSGALFTGNRFGSFWQPIQDASAIQQRASELVGRCQPGTAEYEFYRSTEETARNWSTRFMGDDDWREDGRRW